MGATSGQAGQERGRATRRDLLEVGCRLFSEHGYHHTGIADIQEATGLTKGAFYHHFRSKEDLALAILESARADYDEQWVGPAMARATPAERIEALLDGAVQLNERPEWRNCQMMVTLSAELTARDGRLREAVRAIQLDFLESWTALMTEAQQAGQMSRAVEAEVAAQWVVNTIAGMLLARKLGTARVPPHQLVAMIKRALLEPSTSG